MFIGVWQDGRLLAWCGDKLHLKEASRALKVDKERFGLQIEGFESMSCCKRSDGRMVIVVLHPKAAAQEFINNVMRCTEDLSDDLDTLYPSERLQELLDDPVVKIHSDLGTIRSTMYDSLDLLFQRGVQLEVLVGTSSKLAAGTARFAGTVRRPSRCRNWFCALVALVVLIAVCFFLFYPPDVSMQNARSSPLSNYVGEK